MLHKVVFWSSKLHLAKLHAVSTSCIDKLAKRAETDPAAAVKDSGKPEHLSEEGVLAIVAPVEQSNKTQRSVSLKQNKNPKSSTGEPLLTLEYATLLSFLCFLCLSPSLPPSLPTHVIVRVCGWTRWKTLAGAPYIRVAHCGFPSFVTRTLVYKFGF